MLNGLKSTRANEIGLVAVVLTLSIHLHNAKVDRQSQPRRVPDLYPDCPLTLSIDYQPKANFDGSDATAPIRSGWGAMVF